MEITFETFILSLGTAALIALGEIDNPITKKKEKNIESAKQHIDILDLLREKTRQNLTKEEEHLLKEMLYNLQIKYVEQQKKS